MTQNIATGRGVPVQNETVKRQLVFVQAQLSTAPLADPRLSERLKAVVLKFHAATISESLEDRRGARQCRPAAEGSGMLNSFSWPRLAVSDGSLEALKWLALVLMTVDHVSKFLFNGTDDAAFAAGRVAMPLFVFALAYNMARPGVLECGAYLRTMKRLALLGALAIPAFVILGGIHAALRPLNIMFALLALAATLNLLDRRTAGSYAAAAAVFLVGGANVEYSWPALAFGLAVWWYCKQPGAMPLALALTALAALWFINSNLWAFLALLVVLIASLVDLRMPRVRWVFYAYYPVHLFALCLIRIPMSKAGYLFF